MQIKIQVSDKFAGAINGLNAKLVKNSGMSRNVAEACLKHLKEITPVRNTPGKEENLVDSYTLIEDPYTQSYPARIGGRFVTIKSETWRIETSQPDLFEWIDKGTKGHGPVVANNLYFHDTRGGAVGPLYITKYVAGVKPFTLREKIKDYATSLKSLFYHP